VVNPIPIRLPRVIRIAAGGLPLRRPDRAARRTAPVPSVSA